tara:strand:+ start:553 stop:837 length:285 start_codon:yes stop_codon:yes gene_type:complete
MPAWLVKVIFTRIFKALKKRREWKQMEDYVNKPNELDKQMKQVQKNLNNCLKYNEDLEKEVAILRKDSHPPIFGKSDIRKIEKRLKKLERKKGD